jgi:hypothetical protein
MYEIDDLDSSGQCILLCATTVYIYVGRDTMPNVDGDEVLCTRVAQALKAGAGDLPKTGDDVTLKVVREVRDAGAPVYNEFMDAFEEGL